MPLPSFQEWAAACDRLAPAMLNAAAGSAVILGLAALASAAMRRASAAARHEVWRAGFVGVLVLPILSAVLPGWHVLPRTASRDGPVPAINVVVTPPSEFPQTSRNSTDDGPATANASGELSKAPPTRGAAGTPRAPQQVSAPAPSAPHTQAIRAPGISHIHWPALLLLCWGLGSLLVLSRVLLAGMSLWRLRGRCSRLTSGELFNSVERLRNELGLRRRIELLTSPARAMPMTWGIWRARLLLPEQATSWPSDQRRDVLLHELGHVLRSDCLSQLLSQLGCCAYWFNPLAWLAARRMSIERERACDDLVLNQGTDAPAYARHLLHTVLSAPGLRPAPAAIAMARPSTLEERMRAILNQRTNRRAQSARGSLATTLLLLAALLPVALLRAQTAPQPPAETGPSQPSRSGRGRPGSFATTRPDDAPMARPFGGARGGGRPGFGAAAAPVLREGPTCTLDATIYDVRLPVDQIGRLDVEALAKASASADSFEKALAALGKAQPLYRADQSVRLAGDTITIGSELPMVTSSRITDKGQTINSIQYMSTGAIFTLAGRPDAQGGVDLDLNIQVSSASESAAAITDKVNAAVMRKATLSHKGPVQPGKPFVVLSVDAGAVDKDGKAVAYIGRVTLGEPQPSAGR